LPGRAVALAVAAAQASEHHAIVRSLPFRIGGHRHAAAIRKLGFGAIGERRLLGRSAKPSASATRSRR